MGNYCTCVSDKSVAARNKELVQSESGVQFSLENHRPPLAKIRHNYQGLQARKNDNWFKNDELNGDLETSPQVMLLTQENMLSHHDSRQSSNLPGQKTNEMRLIQANNHNQANLLGGEMLSDLSKELNKLAANKSRNGVSKGFKAKFLDEVPEIINTNVQELLQKLPPFSYASHKELNPTTLHFPTFGPILLESGVIYIGQWKIQSPNGISPKLKSSHENDLFSGVRHGKGKQIWPDGAVYEGFWKDDQVDGYGRLIHADGDYYEGQWKNDKAHGKGKYVHPDGAFYEGDWVNDIQEGQGVEQNPDGSIYTGEFVGGMKHGKGKFVWKDGSLYTGDFKQNEIAGKGQYTWSDGRVYDGEWVDSKMHGYGVFTWKDGRKYEGSYKNDQKDGYGVYYLGDGRKYEGQWKDGLQDGKGVFTNIAGVSRTGYWSQGKRISWESSISHSGTTSKNEQLL